MVLYSKRGANTTSGPTEAPQSPGASVSFPMTVRLYRGFLAIAAFGLVSLTINFWCQQELDELSHHGFAHRHVPSQPSQPNDKEIAPLRSKPGYLKGKRASPVPSTSISNSSVLRSFASSNGHGDASPPAPNVVHIVYTRFMQHQSHLTSLGLARLRLMKEVFVPSLQVQTTDNFLVVIRVDPELDDRVKRPLLELFPNATHSDKTFRYLMIGTNNNPLSHQYENLRNLVNGDGKEDRATIWSGTIDDSISYLLLTQRNGSPGPGPGPGHTTLVLETRLDSDDGLNRRYLESLQSQARKNLLELDSSSGGSNSGNWKMWCAGGYLEWQYTAPWDLNRPNPHHRLIEEASTKDAGENTMADTPGPSDEEESESGGTNQADDDDSSLAGLGGLISLRSSGCVTAGLSIAYFDTPFHESTTTRVPVLENHERLAAIVPHCRGEKDGKPARTINCLSFSKLNPSVLRARTPTSAGMLNVFLDWDSSGAIGSSSNSGNNTKSGSAPKVQLDPPYRKYQKGAMKQKPFQNKLWKVVEFVFGVTPSGVRELRKYLKDNIVGIAKDNLEGQCSAGHSCKNSSQVMLRSIVERGSASV